MHRTSEQQSTVPLPNWLRDRFLQEVIRKARKDISITLCHDCKIRPVGEGVRHASGLYRTTVHYRSGKLQQEQAVDLMVKVDRDSSGRSNHDSKFELEIRMYNEVLPALEKVLKQVNESIDAPRYFFSAKDPQQMIIMEDMFPNGWIQAGKIDSFENVLPAIKTMAKLHAASIIVNQNLSPNLCSFNCGLSETQVFKLKADFNQFYTVVCSWSGCTQLGAKLRSQQHSFEKKLRQVYSPSVELNVLNHGDISSKNLFHKMQPPPNKDRIVGSNLIDFQRCHWGSPAIDLMCLLNLVVDREVKRKHRDRIVREYFRNLEDFLNQLGYGERKLSLQLVEGEMRRCAFLELIHLMIENNPSESNEILHRKYNTDIQQELQELLRRGVLD